MSGDSVSARLARLSPEQRALLARRIKGDANSGGQVPPTVIPRRANQSIAPLSLAQEGLWLLHQYAPDSVAYNIFGALRIRGALDTRALEASLSEVIRRHDVLRTNFRIINEVPQQVVAPARPIELPLKDFTHLSGKQQYDEMFAWARQDGRRPFNLESEPLFRGHLVRLKDDEHVLLLTVHHIISDGWSLGIAFHETLTLYCAGLRRRTTAPEQLPIQFGDYAAWQRAHFRNKDLEKQIDYWRKKLAGVPPLLDLPLDRPRPSLRRFAGNRLLLQFPQGLQEHIAIFLKQTRVTLFMLLLSAYAILLHRYTGSSTIPIGSPIARRPAPELEKLIGLFINSVVFRFDFDDDPRIIEFVARTRLETTSAYEHCDVPFEQLVGALNIPRETTHSPIFQVMFALTPQLSVPPTPGLEVNFLMGSYDGSKFDLAFFVGQQTDGSIAVSVEYATDLFDSATIERLADHYTSILDAMLADPERRLSALEFMKDWELQRLLTNWNAARSGQSEQQCGHELVAAQAARKPDALAVKSADGETMSYAELDRKSTR